MKNLYRPEQGMTLAEALKTMRPFRRESWPNKSLKVVTNFEDYPCGKYRSFQSMIGDFTDEDFQASDWVVEAEDNLEEGPEE